MASELKPCAHCGGAAELDYQQPFCAFPSGKMEKQVAIYCTECDVHMSMCYSDFPEYDHDQMAAILTEKWNIRPTPVAPVSPDATGKCGELERYGQNWHDEMEPNKDGEYVRFDQAVELLAAERAKADEYYGEAVVSYDRKLRVEELEADNAALTAQVKELEDYAREATKAITGLTGGGSENFGKAIGDLYPADLPHCLERIRERYVSKVELKRLEAKLAAAEKVRVAAEHVVWFDWSDNDDDAVKAVSDLRAALGGKLS